MSLIKQKFFHLFWNNKSCQNLFLLSKEELLESIKIGDNKPFVYTTNRIIVSNVQEASNQEVKETIENRSNIYNLELDNSLQSKIEYFTPLFNNFLDSNFKKSFDRLSEDIKNDSSKLVKDIFRIVFAPEKFDQIVIKRLQEYGFIGKNINSLKELEDKINTSLIPSKNNELINEDTIKTFLDALKYIKELYVNQSFKSLYATNQVLINTLNSDDNFESRITLFGNLYDSKIIVPSEDDAFIECINCDKLTYKGVFQLRLNPKKLKDLKCPVCKNELSYFVPYELDENIYHLVKSHDGLLIHALENNFRKNNRNFDLNKKFFNDIEIDCILYETNRIFFIEVKMYKQNTTKRKLVSKLKEHFIKLIKDAERVSSIEDYKNFEIIPILLTNIIDINILNETKTFFVDNCTEINFNQWGIVNIDWINN